MAVQAEHQTQIGMPLDEFIRQYDDAPFELVNGERIPLMPPVAGQALVVSHLARYLLTYEENSSEFIVFLHLPFVWLNSKKQVINSRTPKLLGLLKSRLETYKQNEPHWKNMPLVLIPDLCVEILSPTETFADFDTKIDHYFRDGVRLVWLLDLWHEMISVCTPISKLCLTSDDTLDGGDVLPGFTAPVRTLFPE